MKKGCFLFFIFILTKAVSAEPAEPFPQRSSSSLKVESIFFKNSYNLELADTNYFDDKSMVVGQLTRLFESMTLPEIGRFLKIRQKNSPFHSTPLYYFGESFQNIPPKTFPQYKKALDVALSQVIDSLSKIPKVFLELIPYSIRSLQFSTARCPINNTGFFYPTTKNIILCLHDPNPAHMVNTTFIHELGHAIDFYIPVPVSRQFRRISWKRGLSYFLWKKKEASLFPTLYSRKSDYEDFAESFEYYAVYPSELKNNYPERFKYFAALENCLLQHKQDLLKVTSCMESDFPR